LSGRLNAQEEKASHPGDSLKNPFTDKTISSLKGKKIYIQNCLSCHGVEGLGKGLAGINLAPKPDNLSSKEIHKLSDGALYLGISDGAHGAMIPWKFMLSDNQRWHLVDYIRELKEKSK
jgi:mono/diheme cytochrome c family protein